MIDLMKEKERRRMNKVILIGRVAKDVESSTTASGVEVAKFSIAVQRKFKNAEGNYEADFFNIIAWRKTAEICSAYVRKGERVGVVGSLQTRSYDGNDGAKRHVTEVIADEIELLSNKNESQGSGESFGGDNNRKPRVKTAVADMQMMTDDELPF